MRGDSDFSPDVCAGQARKGGSDFIQAVHLCAQPAARLMALGGSRVQPGTSTSSLVAGLGQLHFTAVCGQWPGPGPEPDKEAGMSRSSQSTSARAPSPPLLGSPCDFVILHSLPVSVPAPSGSPSWTLTFASTVPIKLSALSPSHPCSSAVPPQNGTGPKKGSGDH